MLRASNISLGLAAALLAFPTLASAQSLPGLYIGAGAGANFVPNETDFTNRQLAGQLRAFNIPTSAKGGSEVGFAGVLSAGYAFGNGIRAEVEGSYRQNEAGTANSASQTTSGTGRTFALMGNAFYDFRIPSAPWIVPYIGGGVGYAWRQADRLTLVDRSAGGTFITDGT